MKWLHHSMAMVNLNKSKETTPTTTTALKVAPQRTIFHKNWNPPFRTSLHKISNVIFFRLTKFFFRNKKFFCKEQLLLSFLCIVRQKKISERSEKFWKFLFLKIYFKKNIQKVRFQFILILVLLGMYLLWCCDVRWRGFLTFI